MGIADIQNWDFSQAKDYITNNSLRVLSTELYPAEDACKKIAALFSERISSTTLEPIPQGLALRALTVLFPTGNVNESETIAIRNYIQELKDDVINNINEEDQWGNTVLTTAVLFEKEKIIDELVKKGSDVNNNQYEIPLLHLAAYAQKAKSIRALINNGAKIDEKTVYGITPLHAAAMTGQKECIKELLLKGANVEEKDDYGLTPLFYSALNENTDGLIELLERGANTDVKTIKERFTVLHLVASNGNTKALLELFKQKVNIEEKDAEGWTALHIAFKNNQRETALELIKKGANLFNLDKESHSPLKFCDLDFLEEVKSLFSPKMQEVITLVHFIENNDVEEIELKMRSWNDLPDLLLYAYSMHTVASLLVQNGADKLNNFQIQHLVEKLTPKEKEKYLLVLTPQEQVALLNPLPKEEKDKLINSGYLVETPHLMPTEWLQRYREFRKILPFSLPSQIQHLEVYDVLIPEFTTLKEKLDRIEQSLKQEITPDSFSELAMLIDTCNISFLQMMQQQYDRKVNLSLKNPRLVEQRDIYKSKENLKKQTIDELKERLQKIEETFEPIRKRFEADIPPDYLDPVSKELMKPDDCWCDPTTDNKKMCSMLSFGEGRSPYTNLPVDINNVVKPPDAFIINLNKLQEAKAKGVDALIQTCKDVFAI